MAIVIDMQETYLEAGYVIVYGIGVLILIGISIIGGYKLWYLKNRLKQVFRI